LRVELNPLFKALHLTAIPLRFIAAGELIVGQKNRFDIVYNVD